VFRSRIATDGMRCRHTHERPENLASPGAGRCKHDSLIPQSFDPWCVQRIRKDSVVRCHRVSERGGNGVRLWTKYKSKSVLLGHHLPSR